ncbi:Spermatogenesis associated 6-like protein [Eumeta japonica]|uniref:Spermatogenesis associated 6-like protein n=1 Tax=Eumeta variegata TaxID=151549 RepID=A0A4C1UMD6_EUMVA|nr:Spermatogenesis associated 6-like protein [Eumeta japonica]
MSKQLELTIDLEIRRVTCPGVWLCQDGSVSLILHALNSTYQTHLVPPVFPMIFKSTFQFRKKFPISCAVRNLGCVLKDEDFYCELVQWTSHCVTDEGVILAQYLGAIPDILFVPEVCSSEGIDLLMRRTKDYPGILAPKIEIATRVRLEEISSSGLSIMSSPSKKCKCTASKESHSHKPVCHTSQYHRSTCDSKNDIENKNLSPKKSKICHLPIEKESVNCRDFCNTSDVFSASIDAGSWRRAVEEKCSHVLDEDDSYRNENAVFNASNDSVGSWLPRTRDPHRVMDKERESILFQNEVLKPWPCMPALLGWALQMKVVTKARIGLCVRCLGSLRKWFDLIWLKTHCSIR